MLEARRRPEQARHKTIASQARDIREDAGMPKCGHKQTKPRTERAQGRERKQREGEAQITNVEAFGQDNLFLQNLARLQL